MIEAQPTIDAQPAIVPTTIVSLSEAAAVKLRELTKDEPNPEIGLRVYVYSGGCSGYRYGMMLEDQPTSDDNVLNANGVRVYIDNDDVYDEDNPPGDTIAASISLNTGSHHLVVIAWDAHGNYIQSGENFNSQ